MSQSRKPPIMLRLLQALGYRSTSPTLSESFDLQPSRLGTKQDTTFNLDNFLMEEYRHSSSHLLQILQERSGTFNLYFLLISIFVSGLAIGYQLGAAKQQYLSPLIILSAVVFGVIHFFFFSRFIYLEIAFYEDIVVMKAIRDFYRRQFRQIPDISDILQTRAKLYALYGIHPRNSLVLFALAFNESVCFALAAFIGSELLFHINGGLFLPPPADLRPYSIGLVIGIIVLVFHIVYYRLYFRERLHDRSAVGGLFPGLLDRTPPY